MRALFVFLHIRRQAGEVHETHSDTTSEAAWRKGRKLPVVPDEEPVTSAMARRQLVRERLSGKGAGSHHGSLSPRDARDSRAPLRASSSLDSATYHRSSPPPNRDVHRPASVLAGHLSPYSSLSDIEQLLQSAGRITPTLTAAPGKTSTGLLIDQLMRSPSRGAALGT